jgi:hypothetical protein
MENNVLEALKLAGYLNIVVLSQFSHFLFQLYADEPHYVEILRAVLKRRLAFRKVCGGGCRSLIQDTISFGDFIGKTF